MDFVIYGHSSSETALPAARANLRAWKTSPVPIYHEMHTLSYNFLYIRTLSLWLALSPLSASLPNRQTGVVYELY